MQATLSDSESVQGADRSLGEQLRADPDSMRQWEAALAGSLDELHQTTEAMHLRPVDAGRGDWLLGWVAAINRSRLILVILGSILLGAIPVGIAAIEGNLFRADLAPDVSHDLGYWNIFVLAFPSVLLVINLYLGSLPRTLLRLATSSTFEVTREKWNEFAVAANKIYGGRAIAWIPWLAGAGFWVMPVQLILAHKSWHRPPECAWPTIAVLSSLPFVFLFVYGISTAILRVGATYFVLKRFFQMPANISPLHPDRCGGLGPLGSLSVRLNVSMLGFGLVSLIGVVSNVKVLGLPILHAWNVMLVAAYLGAALIVFFLPLQAAHRRMLEAKYRTLESIHQRFDQLNKHVLSSIGGAGEVDEDAISQLEKVRKIYDIASQMPVYPFNAKIVASFFGTLGMPLLLVLLREIMMRLVWQH